MRPGPWAPEDVHGQLEGLAQQALSQKADPGLSTSAPPAPSLLWSCRKSRDPSVLGEGSCTSPTSPEAWLAAVWG